MSKVLCIFAIAVSAILFLLFLLDFVSAIPFGRVSFAMDLAFIICSAVIGFFGYLTFREQR
jgi:hypothetical protein